TIAIRADIAINQTIYLFPNPVQDIAKIIFTPIANNTTYLKLVSSTGLVMINRKIATNTTGNTLYELDVSQLPKGVYNVEIVTGVGRVIGSKRLIKP
ncbi:MAG: T9SS C-terminal target domain-containing protein, partial [Sphingobacteriia bacterium]